MNTALENVPLESEESLFKVPYTTIVRITPHGNADKLEVAWVYDFQVVVRKGQYQVGTNVIYVPIDSILPTWLEDKLFPADSKIKLHHNRVRQIRIRGLASQGMLIDADSVKSVFHHGLDESLLEADLSKDLGITKYEPPQRNVGNVQGKDKQRNRKQDHPLFHKYNGVSNMKWFPSLFQEGEEVVIQEKLHGTNARASVLPFVANTLWKKFLKLVRLAPAVELCYGSNNVEISARSSYKGFYGEDIYGKVFNELKVFEKLKLGETIFGEIIGEGIQKNYSYGLKEHKFVLFDVKVLQSDGTQMWLTPDEVKSFALERGFDYIPVLYEGPFNKEHAYSLAKGASIYSDYQVIEGVVVKSRNEYNSDRLNKKALKIINEDYLADKSNSDFH